MATSSFYLHFLTLLLVLLLINRPASCHGDHDENDEEKMLFDGINTYRSSLNLSTLTKNENAECLASEIADQFKNQPCTNTTGADTVPGMEPNFPNYPILLTKCHLNISDTKDGSIMPACVPGLVSTTVLTNFTQSQYTQFLNDTKYTAAGIGSEGDWIVVIMTTNTSTGSFAEDKSAGLVSKVSLFYHMLFLLVGCFLL